MLNPTETVKQLETKDLELSRLRSALAVFGRASMSEVSPVRKEFHIGWQDVDGEYGVSRDAINTAIAIAREF